MICKNRSLRLGEKSVGQNRRSATARWLAVSAAATMCAMGATAQASTWELTTGGSWATATNWDPDGVPNAAGAVVAFTPINTANRALTLDSGASGFTVGSISFDLTGMGTFTNAIGTGSAGSKLIFDNGGAGVSITTTGDGTGNNSLGNTGLPMVLNDDVTATVNQITTISATGSLNVTGAITGTKGWTKAGPGQQTFGTGTKLYTGPTNVIGGRLRMSLSGAPTATSGLTINGGQIDQTVAGSYTFGPNAISLSGTGPVSGPYAAFPGVIRPDSNLAITITNAITLTTDSLIHVQGSTGGVMTLSGKISGAGLILTGANSDNNLGKYILTNAANDYTGGTTINGGTLDVSSGGSLGSGPLTANVVNFGAAQTTVLLPAGGITTGRLAGTNLGGAGVGTITINNNGGTHTVNQLADGTYDGTIIGGGGLTMSSASTNTLTLTGANIYSGLTSLNGGTLSIGSTNNIGGANISFNGGTLLATGTISSAARNVVLPGNGTINTNNNGVTVGTIEGVGGITKSGAGVLTATHVRSGPLNVSGGQLLITAVADPTSNVSVPNGVSVATSVAATGQLNLTNNRLITKSPQGTKTGLIYSDVLGLVQTGRNGGTWNGNGIMTNQSDALANKTSIGVATAAEAKGLSGGATTMWSGQTIASDDTLVMYTYAGDANLDGAITADDYASIDLYFLQGNQGTWYRGDFNYDGSITADDYALIDASFIGNYTPLWVKDGPRGTAGLSAVPEPASLSVLALGAVGLLSRRRRTK